MYISKYVKKIIFNDDNIILYNKFNGAIYLISSLDMSYIDNVLKSKIDLEDNKKDEISKHVDILKQQKFIVDEENIVELEEHINHFLITIETTSFCNLNCTYCYETDKGSREIISDGVIYAIYQYIESVLDEKPDLNLRVGFIGGEPLLAKDKVISIMNEISAICDERKRSVHFHIDTNGTVDFSDMYQLYNDLNISVSLTLPEDHNVNRPGNGFDSFSQIILNLKKLKKKNENTISIRYNTNENNIHCFEEFVKYIAKEIDVVDYINPMYTDEYEHNIFKNKLNRDEFITWNSTEAIKILVENKFKIGYGVPGKLKLCVAYQPYSCKVYSDGIVTLCDAMYHADSDISIHEIKNDISKLEQYFSQYKLYNPLNDKKCSKCSDILLCQGEVLCRKEKCEYKTRFNLELFIRSYVKFYLEGKGEYFYKM